MTDTEDLISLDLDHRRNELVALNLVVNCIMLMFALVSAVTSAFGMNFNTVRLLWWHGCNANYCLTAVCHSMPEFGFGPGCS